MSSDSQSLRSSNGSEIRASDSSPEISISTPGGARISIDGDLIRIESGAARITLDASTVTISAGRLVLDVPMVSASMVRCDTIIATNVIGTNYTPGAGNVY